MSLKLKLHKSLSRLLLSWVPLQILGFVVGNWRNSWKWISNWCFGLIVFFATTPIPPELLAVLPENIRFYLIVWVAFCGFVGRYINQTKPVSLPPIDIGGADV
jgi:hypothetical protein